ncbi:MAG: substrate-binding domain-containing protein [Sphaerochaetaceae bacterium]|nr:substrate-binding domain-containing protein [Sphaerochaetaceae bacterium]MDD4007313.1 substrate-binding domain-containing protein [Sphaerochaetaceae bacterium]
MKKLLVVMLCLIMAAGMVFANAETEKQAVPKIGIAVPSPDHGWTGGIGWWADKAVEELSAQYAGKYEFKVLHADNYAKQISDVEDLMTWGMDYLVILPHDSAPLYPSVKAAHDEGVVCIVVDRGFSADQDFGYLYVAGDNPGLGQKSGEYMRNYMAANGLKNYCVMGGMPVPIDEQRMTAFFDEMEKDSSLVNLQGGRKYEFADWSTQKGLEIMENFIQMFPEIDAVFCQDDDVLTGVLQAIKESGRTDIKLAMGGAGSKPVLQMIMNDDPIVKASATYPPKMIYNAIQLCLDVAEGKRSNAFNTAAKSEQVIIPSEIIDKSNVANFYEADSVY